MLLARPYNFFPDSILAKIAVQTSPFLFICASILVFFRRRLGYGIGLAAGLIAVPWLVLTELLLAPSNSWILLNYEDWMLAEGGGALTFVKLRILSAALIVMAAALSSLRLFPARWLMRGAPLYRRAWPAFTIGLLLLAIWFVRSVTPYSVPGYDHSANAEFRILRVSKRGLRFHETSVMGTRDMKVYIMRAERNLFQYRSEGRIGIIGVASPTTYERARKLPNSADLWKLRTPVPKAFRSWNAEGWYVVLKDSRLLAFTTEYGTAPPEEVTRLFSEFEKQPVAEQRPIAARDVCLGFCYDPIAGLGFSIVDQRTRLLKRNAFGKP